MTPISLLVLLLLGVSFPSPAAQPAKPLPPMETILGLVDAPFKGDKNAKLTIVEFSDYQCPFCARHFRETLPQIEGGYIKTGKVKYVLRDFPIVSVHPLAFKAAEAANCAGDQGKYWEMHDQLFANQKALTPPDLSRHARAVGLDMARFQPCLDSGRQTAKIRADIQDGILLGVKSTPTFLLVQTEQHGQDSKGIRGLKGAAPYKSFQKAIDSLLAAPQKP
jgi:protein-disulfide isomerase